MTPNNFIIREIKLHDNRQILQIINDVLTVFGIPEINTTYKNKTLNYIFNPCNHPKKNTLYIMESTKNLYKKLKSVSLDKQKNKSLFLYFLEA